MCGDVSFGSPYESETNDGIIMPKESRALKPRQRFTVLDLVIKDVMLLHKDIPEGGKEIFSPEFLKVEIFLKVFSTFASEQLLRGENRLRGLINQEK